MSDRMFVPRLKEENARLRETVDALRARVAELEAAPSEPVAWTWHFKNASYPSYCERREVAESVEADGITVVPLYTRPAPRKVTEADAQDVLREMVTAVRNGNAIAPILTAALALAFARLEEEGDYSTLKAAALLRAK